jgi:UPF0755 protein
MRRFLILVVVLGVLAAIAAAWENADFVGPGPAAAQGGETVVLIAPHLGLRGISEQLAEDGVIDNALLFQIGVRARGRTSALKAGEFAIPSRASMADIMDILVAGK